MILAVTNFLLAKYQHVMVVHKLTIQCTTVNNTLQKEGLNWWNMSNVKEEISNTETSRSYPAEMLPEINYKSLDKKGITLAELERVAAEDLSTFIEIVKTELSKRNKRVNPEDNFIIGYLSSYLGYLVGVTLGEIEAKKLLSSIAMLIQAQASHTRHLFSEYPLHAGNSQKYNKNLQQLKDAAPGNIIICTLGLHTSVMEMIRYLRSNYKEPIFNYKFPFFFYKHPHNKRKDHIDYSDPVFMTIVQEAIERIVHERKYFSRGVIVPYLVNQMSIQIGWLTGCASLGSQHEVAMDCSHAVRALGLYIKYGAHNSLKKLATAPLDRCIKFVKKITVIRVILSVLCFLGRWLFPLYKALKFFGRGLVKIYKFFS